jgi:hypothetical protein
MEHSNSSGFGKSQELCIDPSKDQTSLVSEERDAGKPLQKLDQLLGICFVATMVSLAAEEVSLTSRFA